MDEETDNPEEAASVKTAPMDDETEKDATSRDDYETHSHTDHDEEALLGDANALSVDNIVLSPLDEREKSPIHGESPPHEREKSPVCEAPPPVNQELQLPVAQDVRAPPPPINQELLLPPTPPPVRQDVPPPLPVQQEVPPPPAVRQDIPPPPTPPPVRQDVPPPPPVEQEVPPPPPPPPVGQDISPPPTSPPPPPPVEQRDEEQRGKSLAPNNTPAANPHAKPKGDSALTLDSATWAECNAEAPKNPLQERVKTPLGEAEKASQKERRKQKAEEDEAFQNALADFDLEMDSKAEEIALKFHKEVDDVKQAIRAVSFLSTDRAVNLQNAKTWKIRTEVNDVLPAGEKHPIAVLQKMVREDPHFQNMTDKDEEALIMEFEAHPDKKVVGTRLSNASAARDVTVFTKRVHHKLCSLQKRTGAIGVCVIGWSSVSDLLAPACVGPEEGRQYFPQVLRSTPDQFAVKFDHYTVNRGVGGLELGSNELRKAVADGISDALEQRIGKKVTMKYGDYDQLVAVYGVELLGGLRANTLRWEVMSDARKAEHKAAMATKEKKQQKERCDKDMTREEAAKLWGTSSNKRKASEDSDEGEGERPKRIKKAVMACMTDKEKAAHKPRTSAKSKEIIEEEDDGDYEPPLNKGKAKAKANLSEDDDDEGEEGRS
ncbi:hypothetical protein B0H13DRAFT_2348865 [Mycena leptocephala]|nr:hypothetical protein B0H13DRAFT_2348865 [Mycena leptocephala]